MIIKKLFIIHYSPKLFFLALELAELKGHPDYEKLKEKHMQWLLESKQEERAGELKEREGDCSAALALYLKANLPTRASR